MEAFLDLFDLRLAGGGSDQRVAPNRAEPRSRQAEETEDQGLPAVCGAGGGSGSAEIERRLNAGETIAWDLPRFEVTLPLSPRVWLQVLYRGPCAPPAAAPRPTRTQAAGPSWPGTNRTAMRSWPRWTSLRRRRAAPALARLLRLK